MFNKLRKSISKESTLTTTKSIDTTSTLNDSVINRPSKSVAPPQKKKTEREVKYYCYAHV